MSSQNKKLDNTFYAICVKVVLIYFLFIYFILAAGIVCFDTRLGSFSGDKNEERAQAMIDANRVIFELSAQLKFSLPVYKYISTTKWKKLIEAEDFFYRYQ